MNVFKRSTKEEPPKYDRRKDFAERLRGQREIEEGRRKRLQLPRDRPAPLFL